MHKHKIGAWYTTNVLIVENLDTLSNDTSWCFLILQPCGVPAKTIDGTMFHKLSCYKDESGERTELRERVWSYSNMVRQKNRVGKPRLVK